MSFELSEKRMGELEEIVDEMNKQAEFTQLYDEGTPEYKCHLDRLLSLKKLMLGLEEHGKDLRAPRPLGPEGHPRFLLP